MILMIFKKSAQICSNLRETFLATNYTNCTNFLATD